MEYLSLHDTPHRYENRNKMSEGKYHQQHNGSSLPSMAANHDSRHSPPIQPGEQRLTSHTLPSFSQFLSATQQEPSPPHTPSRRDGSIESSPRREVPTFSDPIWRRSDEPRAGSMDSTASFNSPRGSFAPILPTVSSSQQSGYQHQRSHPTHHHHRPSLPYPPPPASSVVHARHQSTPAPPGTQSHYPQAGSSAVPQHAYQTTPIQGTASSFDHRPSNFHDSHQASQGYTYERPAHDYYGHPAHPPNYLHYGHGAYTPPPASYSYQFHNQQGMDQGTFNRKRRGNLPKEATGILKAWFQAHRDSPYPGEEEKLQLCAQTQLTLNQVSNWFINARRRAPPQKSDPHRHRDHDREQDAL
ncbi:hypothetical protein BU24DRAFT_215756 [Aaosphaeria arxii CBS 175.79]|uniref:Homeobox domain-containing protein n=1 Tax=Aaosphaeria arxii CBS 175.79 TaxID=1450172 RepID=A0A6A5XMM2_9PLEO|nr:uncharacterized protein BU24DRAFT_215756 [Aaosphaeria arxii CBS 175.79]KAF2014495.1 hypothetical protein BU24DRAFT_215756 [Aaosphaeria arxii CBS 175.79]